MIEMMKILLFFVVLVAVTANDTGRTPVETGDGVIPLEYCLLKVELDNDVRMISQQMRSFGISHSTSKSYANYVRHEAASAAKASSKVVCIAPRKVHKVGTRLGDIIWDHVKEDGPTKKRGERPQFDFDAVRDGDDTFAKSECCRCDENEFARRDNGEWGSGCYIGPCCPELCRSLNRLQVAASEGVLECCNRNYRECLHERGVEEGQRGTRDPKFT